MSHVFAATVDTELGSTSALAIAFFIVFIVVSLGITFWAARRTHSTSDFYAAGGALTGRQNGLALAGDYMSAASFLGIAGLVALQGFYGLIYSIGFLVGWPIVLFLIAEPLRNLGKYTFADVVAYRLRQRLVRSAAALSTLAVVAFYLIAQMVGAGTLIGLMFGFDYAVSVVLVGVVMMAYVFFGGMIATSWVQIIKAVLLLGGATLLAILVLVEVGSPLSLFADAEAQYPNALSPEGVAALAEPFDAISLGIALMFGTAGLPHILMRFYTVPNARTARTSVVYATGFIGFFYLLTFIIGFGASVLVGREDILSFGPGGNVSALLLAEELGGTPFLGFIAAVAFATILAVVAGLTLSGAAALSHDLWSNVVRGGREERPGEELRVARAATVFLAILSIALGIAFENQNVAFMVGLAFAIAASANFPALLLSIFWRRFTTWGAVAAILSGLISSLVLIYLGPAIWEDAKLLGNEKGSAPFPLANPALVSMPLSFAMGIIVSLLTKERESEERFAEVQRRVYQGVGELQPTAGD